MRIIRSRRFHFTKKKFMISSMRIYCRYLLKLNIPCNILQICIMIEKISLLKIYIFIITFSRFLTKYPSERSLKWWENLENPSMSIWPIIKWECISIERDNIVFWLHAYWYDICHDIHIWYSLSTICEKWIYRVWCEIPGFSLHILYMILNKLGFKRTYFFYIYLA